MLPIINTITDPRAIEPQCLRRGLSISETRCQTCGGAGRMIKVFACMKWGSCTIRGPQPPGGQVCKACNDRII
jgi:hypothetical protein